ncbi:hypothetical protein C0J52_11202 [Blattella germanica]|nr:hypothetical protein C0J52_11202 [Blattella germanica]
MVGAGYCSRDQLQIKRVAAKAKIHAVYFQEEVMRPIYLQDIPLLYGRDDSKLQIHMDKASSHTAKLWQRFFRQMRDETGIKRDLARYFQRLSEEEPSKAKTAMQGDSP